MEPFKSGMILVSVAGPWWGGVERFKHVVLCRPGIWFTLYGDRLGFKWFLEFGARQYKYK